MHKLIVFEDEGYRNLLPLVYWRACFELRCGRRRLFERWTADEAAELAGLWVRKELAEVIRERFDVPVNTPAEGHVLLASARWVPAGRIGPTEQEPAVGVMDEQIAYILADASLADRLTPTVCLNAKTLAAALEGVRRVPARGWMIRYPWDLVHLNARLLAEDFDSPAIEGRVCKGAHILNESAVRIGPGSVIKPCAVLDAEDGPICIGSNVVVSPNCTIQGPCAIGDGSLIQPGASIREGTTIGPVCKIGGEVEASIIQGYTNKQHDGFLGHAYVGEWVNLGADTVNSDLKNTYGTVRVPINGIEVDSGQMFVGLTVGDHSKTGINQAFPTGSVVGFGCSVATSRLAPKFVPSFTWLTDKGAEPYDPKRCLAVATKAMARRKIEISPAERELFLSLPRIAREHEATTS